MTSFLSVCHVIVLPKFSLTITKIQTFFFTKLCLSDGPSTLFTFYPLATGYWEDGLFVCYRKQGTQNRLYWSFKLRGTYDCIAFLNVERMVFIFGFFLELNFLKRRTKYLWYNKKKTWCRRC